MFTGVATSPIPIRRAEVGQIIVEKDPQLWDLA